MSVEWRSTLSTAGFGEDGGALVTAGWLHASRAAVRLLRTLDQLARRVGPSPRVVGGGTLEHADEDFVRDAWGVRVRRLAFKKGGEPPGGSHAFALSSCIVPFHLSSPQMGRTGVVLFLPMLVERGPTGVGTLQPSLGFKDFHQAARLHSLTNGHPGW
jgi:hypothetical protein